jgi:hypothetical protein
VATNYTKGNALITDLNYQPKAAYWQIQEELNRVIPDGLYRLSPSSQREKCLNHFMNNATRAVQLSNGICNSTNQIWNIT